MQRSSWIGPIAASVALLLVVGAYPAAYLLRHRLTVIDMSVDPSLGGDIKFPTRMEDHLFRPVKAIHRRLSEHSFFAPAEQRIEDAEAALRAKLTSASDAEIEAMSQVVGLIVPVSPDSESRPRELIFSH